MDICASAFGPESELADTTGYQFLFAEPLVELGVKNFDVLIYHAEENRTILVECKSGLRDPGTTIEEMREARNDLHDNRDHLEEALGGDLGFVEYVLCVPSTQTNRAIQHIEQRDDDAFLDDDRNDPMLLWEVNKFDRQTLQLVTRITTREDPENQHGDHELTDNLTTGVEVDDAEVTYRGYPSSHILRLSEEGLVKVMMDRRAADEPILEFQKDELETFFSDPTHIPHYDAEDLATDLADNVVTRGTDLGLLRRDDEDDGLIHIDLGVEKIRSVKDAYHEEFLDRSAEENARAEAERQALEEFRDEYPGLEDFG